MTRFPTYIPQNPTRWNKHLDKTLPSNRCFSISFHTTPSRTLASERVYHRNAKLAINGFNTNSIRIPEYFPQNPILRNNTFKQTLSSNTCLSRILKYFPPSPIWLNTTFKQTSSEQTSSSNNYISIGFHATLPLTLANEYVHHRHVNLVINKSIHLPRIPN